jgi:hypothetical protein
MLSRETFVDENALLQPGYLSKQSSFMVEYMEALEL